MDRYKADLAAAMAEDEACYEAAVAHAAQMIAEKKTVKMVFVSGPSSAGKTPTMERLSHCLGALGVKTEPISLDDFYREGSDNIYNPDGTPDYESPESLDMELLHSCFTSLCEGKDTLVPVFSFPEKRRIAYRSIRLDDDELCIVEGLHALNPNVCGSYIDPAKTFKIYLDAETDAGDNPRLLRRIVRDYYKRDTSAETTLSMWENVERGSRLYVKPYKAVADICINTYIAYERFVLRDDALKILGEVPKDSPFYRQAEILKEELKPLPSIPKSAVKGDSFMTEFITQKDKRK